MALLGEAYAVESGLTGARHFYFTTRVSAPSGGANGDQAYMLTADSGKYAIELFFRHHTTGLLPPGAPSTVELLIYADNGTLWRTVHAAGAPPAQGSVGKFFGTVDGTVATALRCGTAELYIRAQAGGLGSYNVNSRDDGHVGILSCPKELASITFGTANNDTYDNGQPWARGPAANENVRINANGTEPKIAAAHQQARLVLPDASSGGGPTMTNYAATNPGAETGDLTGWTQTIAGTGADTDHVRTGSFAFGITGVNTNYPKYLHQNYNVSAQASAIDVGNCTAERTSYLYPEFAGDEGIMRFEFYDDQLGTTLLGTVDSATFSPNLGNVTQDVFNEVSLADAAIPVGTRMIRFIYIWNVAGGAAGNMAWDDTGDLIVTVPGTGDLIGTTQQVGAPPFTDDFLVGNDFKPQLGTYGARFEILGNALLVPDSGAIPWTFLVDGGGTGLTALDDRTITRDAWVDVDPRNHLANVTSDHAIYNVRELTGLDFNVQNARNENITRSVTAYLLDSFGAVKASNTQATANRVLDYQTVGGDDALNNLTGKQWSLYAEDAGTYATDDVNAWRLSTLKRIHHEASLPVPGDVTSASHMFNATRPGAASNTVLNFGQEIDIEYWVYGVRGQLLQDVDSPDAFSNIINDILGADDSQTVTLVNGRVSYTYAPALSGSGDKAEATLAGSPKHVLFGYGDGAAAQSFDGFGLSSLLRLDESAFGDGIFTGKSDADNDNNGEPDANEFSQFFIGGDDLLVNAKARDAAGDPYDDLPYDYVLKRNGVVVEGPKSNTQSQTENGFEGWGSAFEKFTVAAPSGDRTLEVSGTHGDNALPVVSTDLTFIAAYTENRTFRAATKRAGDLVTLSLEPLVISDENELKNLSEAVPPSQVTIAPKAFVFQANGAGLPISDVIAAQTLTQLVMGDDDHWETLIDVTGYAAGRYGVFMLLSIDGVQKSGTVYVTLKDDATFAALALSGDALTMVEKTFVIPG